METRIQSVHFDASTQLLEFVEKKVAKIEKFCEGATSLEVTMKLTMQNVTAIRIGEAVFVSNQNEIFTEIGLKMKKESPFLYTFVCSLANGHCVYVPTLSAFDMETGGGYETRINPGRLDIHAGDILADKGICQGFQNR